MELEEYNMAKKILKLLDKDSLIEVIGFIAKDLEQINHAIELVKLF